jgi:hypothetical protein
VKTNKKTIEVVDNFKIIAYPYSMQIDSAGYSATLKDRDTNEEFTIPVNKDFISQLHADTNQIIEMEIRFLERK